MPCYSTPAPQKPQKSLQEELAGISSKLKKVEKTQQPMIQGSGKNFLQNALSTAIRNRRNNLHMHDDEDDDDDEDDWDD